MLYSVYDPAIRVPVLIAASVEKFALSLLIFFGPLERTNAMTVTAMDAIFAILFVIYVAG
jgi:hypothetical protein